MSHAQLELIDLHKTFEAGTINENYVIRGLDLSLEPGEFVTVIGGNGAGKSTTMNLIAGALAPDQGRITVAGTDVTSWSTDQRAAKIARVFQDPRQGTATRLSIQENMALANYRGKKRGLRPGVKQEELALFRERLASLGLGLEDRMTADVGFLSGGQRQALTLLMATLVRPELLLLDEHTAALDPKTSQMVLDLTEKIVREQNLTTLMITHNMNDAIRYGDRLLMLHQGQLILDVAGEDKKNLTIVELLELFREASGDGLASDEMLLG